MGVDINRNFPEGWKKVRAFCCDCVLLCTEVQAREYCCTYHKLYLEPSGAIIKL